MANLVASVYCHIFMAFVTRLSFKLIEVTISISFSCMFVPILHNNFLNCKLTFVRVKQQTHFFLHLDDWSQMLMYFLCI